MFVSTMRSMEAVHPIGVPPGALGGLQTVGTDLFRVGPVEIMVLMTSQWSLGMHITIAKLFNRKVVDLGAAALTNCDHRTYSESLSIGFVEAPLAANFFQGYQPLEMMRHC